MGDNDPELSGARRCVACEVECVDTIKKRFYGKSLQPYIFFVCESCDNILQKIFNVVKYRADISDRDKILEQIFLDSIKCPEENRYEP